MSDQPQEKSMYQSAKIIPFIRTSNIAAALTDLRKELETIAPLEKQIIFADQLLYDVCLALGIPEADTHAILGKSTNPYNEPNERK